VNDGSVSRDAVVAVLRKNGVLVTKDREFYVLSGPGNTVESHRLPDVVRRRQLHALARRFLIEVRHFYHHVVDKSEQTPTPIN
jgi:hypothetical protein